MRVIVSALAICAASFLVGVAGDLSASAFQEPPARPQIVQLPPATLPPVDLTSAVRAHPLPVRPVVHHADRAVRLAPATLVLEPPPLAVTPVSLTEAESLAGGPDDSVFQGPELQAGAKRAGKPTPMLAGKSGDERSSKA